VTASTRAWLSYRRIVDVPFRTCVAALDSGQLTKPDGGPDLLSGSAARPGQRDLQGPVRLPRRAAAPPAADAAAGRLLVLRAPRIALELIPCGPVRPGVAYFLVGHQLLDSLARWLAGQSTHPLHDRSTTWHCSWTFTRT
jgi:hypothetical protein